MNIKPETKIFTPTLKKCTDQKLGVSLEGEEINGGHFGRFGELGRLRGVSLGSEEIDGGHLFGIQIKTENLEPS